MRAKTAILCATATASLSLAGVAVQAQLPPPDPQAREYPGLVTGAQKLWRAADEGVHARLAELGEAEGETGLWVSAFVADGDVNPDGADFSQDQGGALIGYDIGLPSGLGPCGQLALGVMAGFVGSSLDFDHSETEIDFDGPAIGGYARCQSGPFDFALTTHLQMMRAERRNPLLELDRETEIVTFGFSAQGGYTHQFGSGYFVRPELGLSYIAVDADPFSDAGGEISFEDDESLFARLGGKAGRNFDFGSWRLRPYISGSIGLELMGDNTAHFAGEQFSNDIGGTVTRIGAGIRGANRSRHIGFFLDVDYSFGTHNELRATAGLRAAF